MEGAASHAVAVTGLLLALVVEAHPQVTWQKHPTNPVISSSLAGTVLSPSVLFDSTTNQYRMWFTSASSGWRIFSASSEDGTTWTLYSGNPVLTAGERPWENDGVCHADVIYDGTRFRMYYTGLGPPTLAAIGLAFSNDGVNWTRYSGEPILERVSGTWESVHVSWPKVYFDGSGYRMLYLGYNGTFTETGLATSADGISWIKHPANPVLRRGSPGSWDQGWAAMNALVVHNGIFYLFYEGSHPDVTAAGFAISQDCKTWTKYSGNPVFFAGAPGSWDSRIYRGSMIFQNNSFRYWYSGHGSDWQIGYATSPFTPLEVPDRPREVPGDYLLEQSYPNPFNPEAIIKYGVPTGTHVTITIFDELGRKISTLVNEHKTPGMYAVSWRGDNVAGGVYWYRMTAGNYTCAKRMLLVK